MSDQRASDEVTALGCGWAAPGISQGRHDMKVYLMTDLEGVAGVLNFEDWCTPQSRYYEMAKEFLTEEVNAAVAGFYAAGATSVLVADGHGYGALNPKLLDPRAELLRGWATSWPLGLEEGYDLIAWVGQHAKARTPCAHLAHTQGFNYLDLSINGVSIGEFGQLAMCASELGIRAVFASGDKAFSEEARALVTGIEAVAVKRGNRPGTGDECGAETYGKRNLGAIHLQPELARARIREGAERAVRRARTESFGLIPLKAPFERAALFRGKDGSGRTISRESHPTSVIALMGMPFKPVPLAPDDPALRRLTDG
ncbi:MAG: hypothetical protein FJ279_30710 [Planctomycetes bacterium]|nr:hypothetical protein [Planctomycetota bacterium]